MVKDGSLFDDWLRTLRTLGYTVEHETFVAADYGDPQTRTRLFVQGRLEHEPAWPAPTHSPDGTGETEPYRTAAEIIDWSAVGESMWTRSRPLVRKTNRRIAQGIREYGADALAPFADAIAELTKADVRAMQADPVPVDEAAAAAEHREEPFLVEGPALVTGGDAIDQRATSLCVPQTMAGGGGGTARSALDRPVPTVTAKGGVIHYIDPQAFVLPRDQRQRDLWSNPPSEPTEEACHTITAKNHDGHVVEPCLIPLYGERPGQAPRTHAIDAPTPTIPASKAPAGVSRPFLVNYQGAPRGEDDALPTVLTSDTMALCVPEAYPWGLDVRYRLLQPRETKRAQGFPADYELAATTISDKRELIGNAVPVGLATSLCRRLLEPTNAPTLNNFGETPAPAAEQGVGDDD
jgi:DNA (cytosine-5)-methyltransferase 1